MESKTHQDAYSYSLVCENPIKRRRPRKGGNECQASYKYQVSCKTLYAYMCMQIHAKRKREASAKMLRCSKHERKQIADLDTSPGPSNMMLAPSLYLAGKIDQPEQQARLPPPLDPDHLIQILEIVLYIHVHLCELI